jgi:hypothetical protein
VFPVAAATAIRMVGVGVGVGVRDRHTGIYVRPNRRISADQRYLYINK